MGTGRGEIRGGGKRGEEGTITIYFTLRQIYKPLWLIINQCHGEGGREVKVEYLQVRITIPTEGKRGRGRGGEREGWYLVDNCNFIWDQSISQKGWK